MWLPLSLAALACWGLWGLFANLASRHLNAWNAILWEVAGAVLVAVVAFPLVVRDGALDDLDVRGILYALLTGASYTLGLGLVFLALASSRSSGKTGSVHTILLITALYPLIASVLNFAFLHEPLSTRQLLAMPLALLALLIVSTDGP